MPHAETGGRCAVRGVGGQKPRRASDRGGGPARTSEGYEAAPLPTSCRDREARPMPSRARRGLGRLRVGRLHLLHVVLHVLEEFLPCLLADLHARIVAYLGGVGRRSCPLHPEDLLAVRGCDQPLEEQLPALDAGLPRDRRLAVAVQGGKEGPLASDGLERLLVRQGPEVVEHPLVVGAALEADGALGDGGQHLPPLQHAGRVLRHVHPLEACVREQSGVDVAALQLAQPGLHVAAEVHALKRWVHAVDLRLAPQRRRADNRAVREVGDPGEVGVAADEAVARVLPRQHRAQLRVRDQIRRHVLRGVDAEVHLLGRQRDVELPGEEALAANF
mmetsp:Transcript_119490/g.320719  ORF Transcript_119490/g.320719 Transcript_119490/m.320719 type:complete len:332 (+) Transcript_119490:431-1426(+)